MFKNDSLQKYHTRISDKISIPTAPSWRYSTIPD